jgi:hypothetical protein
MRVPIGENLKLGRAASDPSLARGRQHDSGLRDEIADGCGGIFGIGRIAVVTLLDYDPS